MLIEVNGRTEAAPPPEASLGDVVADLRLAAASSRRVVSGLVLDGEPLTPERETAFSVRPASDFERLEAEVVGPPDLVRKVFSGLSATIPAIASVASEAGSRIRVGDAAGHLVGRVAEDLAFVVEAYQDGLRLMEAYGSRLEAGSRATSQLEDVLNEIIAGLASGDMVSLGDALEHQFGPALDAFSMELREWAAALRSGDGPGESGASS